MQRINNRQKTPMSKVRKTYMGRLIGRCIALIISILVWIYDKEQFVVLEGMNFFKKLSLPHILWGIWLLDMLSQLIPVKSYISLGSQKNFASRFRAAERETDEEALRKYTVSSAKGAAKVLVLWVCFIAVIGACYHSGLFDKSVLLLITIFFYVCDLICVLIWCPFRVIMGNRCCTTCRIFNWDHLMMFSPMIFVGGFYAMSLFYLALAIFIVWELCVFLHPERFWEQTNVALKCVNCTDKLCTQYCGRARRT